MRVKCKMCGTVTEKARQHAKFCSDNCKNQHYQLSLLIKKHKIKGRAKK